MCAPFWKWGDLLVSEHVFQVSDERLAARLNCFEVLQRVDCVLQQNQSTNNKRRFRTGRMARNEKDKLRTCKKPPRWARYYIATKVAWFILQNQRHGFVLGLPPHSQIICSVVFEDRAVNVQREGGLTRKWGISTSCGRHVHKAYGFQGSRDASSALRRSKWLCQKGTF